LIFRTRRAANPAARVGFRRGGKAQRRVERRCAFSIILLIIIIIVVLVLLGFFGRGRF
jgi:hypothetical protein